MAKISVYKTKPTPTSNGVTNLTKFTKKRGVYKIFENNKLIYIGFSTHSLYHTILRHFNEWNDSKQEKRINYKSRVAGNSYQVQVELMQDKPDAQIEQREAALIIRHKPRDNKEVAFCSFDGNCKSKLDIAKERLKKVKDDKKKKAATKTKIAASKKKKVAKKTVKRAVKKPVIDDVPF